MSPLGWLYAKNNFYYCRSNRCPYRKEQGYMPKIISTIVDCTVIMCLSEGYMPKIISTIVDQRQKHYADGRLYAKNNFYYCR